MPPLKDSSESEHLANLISRMHRSDSSNAKQCLQRSSQDEFKWEKDLEKPKRWNIENLLKLVQCTEKQITTLNWERGKKSDRTKASWQDPTAHYVDSWVCSNVVQIETFETWSFSSSTANKSCRLGTTSSCFSTWITYAQGTQWMFSNEDLFHTQDLHQYSPILYHNEQYDEMSISKSKMQTLKVNSLRMASWYI